ncbi:RNA_pol_Rpc34 domain-containing protein, partial [Cephalotus follicularis]
LVIGMSRFQGPSSLKRKRPDSNSPADFLTDDERILFNVIRSKQDIGIWIRDLKQETNLRDNAFKKSLKALQTKNLIKEVATIQSKGRKHFMAAEYEPSKEITGGAWYEDGKLDKVFINFLKHECFKYITGLKVATMEEVIEKIRRSGVMKVDLTKQQFEEILRALVLDNAIMEVKSNGSEVYYTCVSKGGKNGEPVIGAMASIPCGVCPQISHCTPDGVISPKTCVYYTQWLDF